MVLFIPNLIGIEFFWLCNGWGNTLIFLWIGITLVLSGIIRTGAESAKFSKVEILHLRPLSPSFVFEPCRNCSSNIPLQQRPGLRTTLDWYGIGQKICVYLSCLRLLPRSLWTVQKLSHAMVVVLRPPKIVEVGHSDDKRLLYDVFRGLFQAILLILLTVLFGSTYRGTILEPVLFLSSFIGVVVISRTYSVYFCAWMEKTTGCVMIEYGTPAELTAILTVLLAMPGILIHNTTRGTKYAEGNCLTPNPDCTNRVSSIPKPLPRMLRVAIALSCGLLVLGTVLVISSALLIPLNVEFFTFYIPRTGFLLVCICMVFGSLFNKVYCDLEFVDALGKVVGTVIH